MSVVWKLKAALVLLLTPILSSCATTDATPGDFAEAGRAAGEAAAAQASIDIGPQPDGFYRPVPHAPLVIGEDLIVTLRRERAQLDAANALTRSCAVYNEEKRQNLLNRVSG